MNSSAPLVVAHLGQTPLLIVRLLTINTQPP
jgi:hypothetical protein